MPFRFAFFFKTFRFFANGLLPSSRFPHFRQVLPTCCDLLTCRSVSARRSLEGLSPAERVTESESALRVRLRTHRPDRRAPGRARGVRPTREARLFLLRCDAEKAARRARRVAVETSVKGAGPQG